MDKLRLYHVFTKRFDAYVVSDSMDNAYQLFYDWLKERNYGSSDYWTLERVELVAETDFHVLSSDNTGALLIDQTKKMK